MAGVTEPNESADRAAIEAFTREFLHAFEDLDMKTFIACFTDDATVFFPMPEPHERVQGKQAIQQRFEYSGRREIEESLTNSRIFFFQTPR